MYCVKCGKENDDANVFCVGCGANLKENDVKSTAGNIYKNDTVNQIGQKTGSFFRYLDNNIGKILNWFGKFDIVLGLICLVIAFFAFVAYEEDVFYLSLPAGIGCIASAFPLIGFGVLLTDVHEIRKKICD